MTRKSSLLTSLQIPVYPDFDFDADPGEQAEYANPVTLANQVVRLANVHATVTGRIVERNSTIAQLKAELTTAQHAVEDFEASLLAQYPASTADRKSNKLLDAYVRAKAFEVGERETYTGLIERLRTLRIQLEQEELAIDAARVVLQTIKLQGEHLQTYLSFRKHEAEQTRRYG